MRLVYVMDPMCAWCYGFQPEFEAFIEHFPSANVEWLMGGLAPDATEPMQDSLKNTIAAYWYQIEEVSQVTFNHSYWELNTPYRSTYKACRAVISAEALAFESAQNMVKAIQTAYYLEAKNTSLETTLMECARSLKLDEQHFLKTLRSRETERKLQEHLNITRHFQVSGFPALFYINDSNQAHPLTLGFCKTQKLLERFALVSNE